jgi:flavin reductase (DIM6/NTAB) family NADH-FMN oxidoreductase RutF
MRTNQARTKLTTADPAGVDVKTFWRVLSQRAVGITVVTGRSDSGPVGFLGLSAAHVTANPPTMLVSIDQKTSALAGILSHRCFAINYLPANADALANDFSGKGASTGAGRFVEGEWGTLSSGAPILKNALGVFDCLVEDVIDRGTVSIVIGRVVAVATNEGEPLIFFRGKSWVGVGSPS